MKFAWATATKYGESDVVLFGVPDDSGSHAERKGVAGGPVAVRRVSAERESFVREGKKITFQTQHHIMKKKIYDVGNLRKEGVAAYVRKILRDGKVPVCIGGDHSITAEILKGFDALKKPLPVVYIDSHPDFICSSRKYFGSVVCDIKDYGHISFDKSVEIGIREPEMEELGNIRESHLKTYTMYDIQKLGLNRVLDEIEKRIGNRFYVSVDLDVVDPAFAPGVSTPVPGGMSSAELIFLLKELANLGLAGLDIMELCPPYDIDDRTAHLAAKAIAETLACLK